MANAQLSDSQAAALQELTDLCSKDGLLIRPQGLQDNDMLNGLMDEATLLRFLNARGFDVQGALKQYKESTTAHKNNHIAELYDEIDVKVFEEIRSIYPHWTGRFNKRGLPIFVFDVVNLDNEAIKSYERTRNLKSVPINEISLATEKPVATSLSRPQRALIYHDYVTRFLFPLCSKLSQSEVKEKGETTHCIYLVNIANMTLKQVWDLRNYAQDVSRLLATNYPEVVDRIYVLNAPSYYNTIWGLIKRFIDPVTADKLVIVSPNEVLEELSEDIDLENIPKVFGGEFDYQHAMLPSIAKELWQTINWNDPDSTGQILAGPIKWVRDGDLEKAVAVGREDGISRRLDVLSKISPEAESAYTDRTIDNQSR
uniref:SEC14 cytosolic factor n=1 Tax=Talaromyces marneffei PM1 TaxID=1077442 RepID=A0A093VEW7_TALMA